MSAEVQPRNGSREALLRLHEAPQPPFREFFPPDHPILNVDVLRSWIHMESCPLPGPHMPLHDQTDYRDLVGELNGFCTAQEAFEKQRASTTSDLERAPVRLISDPEARICNPSLTMKSFQRSDANKLFTADTVRSVEWCRMTVHAVVACQVDADLHVRPWLACGQKSFLDVHNFVRDRCVCS
ncbi:MAG: uncharacterized protein KVP18_003419 [Porospora cf. gigantea A]|uniref:uncharacterized protein n=1 Tax=Porospora cf. gigantea A TaxID=2853593 RepID=UPI00355A60CC|nr:MAG: hypothetical protein KVP18_003419 [Porospora cf. gigantea A]